MGSTRASSAAGRLGSADSGDRSTTCALFIAVISLIRRRGWTAIPREGKLDRPTGQRAMPRKRLLVPVVIDDIIRTVRERPEKIPRVQWTQLRRGTPPTTFVVPGHALLSPRTGLIRRQRCRSPERSSPTRCGRIPTACLTVLHNHDRTQWVLPLIAAGKRDRRWVSRRWTSSSSRSALGRRAAVGIGGQSSAPGAERDAEKSIAVLPFRGPEREEGPGVLYEGWRRRS